MVMDERQAVVTEVKSQFHDAMREAFREPISSMMGRSGHISLLRAQFVKWLVDETDVLSAEETAAMGEAFRSGLLTIVRHYGLRAGYESRSLYLFSAARLVHSDRYEGRKRTYQHNEIKRGAYFRVRRRAPGTW